jgi:tetratricopeptide (TPR) repeat protein
MIYWWLANAYDGLVDTTQARNAIAKAFAMANDLSAREKMFIQLQFEVEQPAWDSIHTHQRKMRVEALMDEANQEFSDDAEMWAFTGMLRIDYNSPDGESYQSASRHAIDDYFSKSQQLQYNHFGVWHLLIHMNEGATDFNKALEYGAMYVKAAPAIPHAWHMYAHDLMKTGRVEEAIEKFNYAFTLEEQKYRTENMPPHYDWHHAHNMELLAYCYQYLGKYKEAERIFSELDTLTPFNSYRMGQMRKGHPYFLIHNNRLDEAIALAQKLTATSEFSNRAQGYFIEGLANVFKKNTAAAKICYDKGLFIIDSVKNADLKKGIPLATTEENLAYAYAKMSMIKMGIGLQQDPYDTVFIKQMNKIQATLLKQTGPDPWIDALYFMQMLTQLSIQTGNLTLAETSANNMIKHDANYPGTYWLLAQIKYKQGDTVKANGYLTKAKTGYNKADEQLLNRLKL